MRLESKSTSTRYGGGGEEVFRGILWDLCTGTDER